MSLINFGFLDILYYQYFHRIRNFKGDRFFRRGWGDIDAMQDVQSHFYADSTVPDFKLQWQHEWQKEEYGYWRDGTFETPRYHKYVEDKVARAVFRSIMPSPDFNSPVCILLATTGEEGFETRQKKMALPLLEQGIGTIMLEHPFMGKRRPSERESSRFQFFSELVLFGGMVVDEARALIHWLHDQGTPKIGIFGYSSGGHLAALAASNLNKLDAVVPCVAPHSGEDGFTRGVLSRSCDWRALAKASNCPEEEALQTAREYLAFSSVKNYPPPAEDTTVHIIAASNDHFISRHSTETILQHWPSAEVQWLRGGHVSTIWKQQLICQRAILDALGIG